MGGGQRGGPGATEAIARRFFDFLRDVPRGIIGFEAISDQGEGRPEGVILVSGLGRGAAGARPEPRKIRFRTIPVAISDHGATFGFVAWSRAFGQSRRFVYMGSDFWS